jgi:peptidyl-prolyl cis-trans isomerase D
MMKFLRSQSQTVLVVVLGVIGLGFLFYGNAGNVLTNAGGRASNDYGRIDGEDLSVADLYNAVRSTRNMLIIHGQSEEMKKPGASAQIAEEAWRQLLLKHEADQLHITVSDKELVDYIHGLSIFQKNGVYSPDVYEKEMGDLKNVLRIPTDTGLDPTASAKVVFENLVRDDLRSQAVNKALFSTVRTSAQDVSAQYEKFYAPVNISLVTFDPKTDLATASVQPADIEAEYKAHPENAAYRTPEKRKVDYVLFSLTPDQAKLPDAQKAAAKDALGQKALDFALAFQPEPTSTGVTPPPPDFLAEAEKRGLKPATTDFFATDTPPAGMPPSPAFNSAAFALSKDNPMSKVIELDNGVAVLHLAEIQPSQLRPFDEVKGDIEKDLQQKAAQQSSRLEAQIMAKSLQNLVAKGTDFKTAAESLKLKAETIPSFVPIKAPPADQRLQSVAFATLALKPGQVSDPIPVQSDNTQVVVFLASRDKADPAGLAEFEKRFRQSQDERLQGQVYTDWANWKSTQPGTHRPPDLDSYGSVE